MVNVAPSLIVMGPTKLPFSEPVKEILPKDCAFLVKNAEFKLS